MWSYVKLEAVGVKNGGEIAAFCCWAKRKGENFYKNWVFCDGLFVIGKAGCAADREGEQNEHLS